MYLKVTSHIYHSSIFLLDNPLSFFPPTCPPVSVDVTNHSNPSAHVPDIPISSLSYLCEMQLGLQLSLYSYHDLLIRHFVPPTYPEYHSKHHISKAFTLRRIGLFQVQVYTHNP